MAFTQSASFRFCTILPLKTRTSLPLSSTKCLPSYVHAQHTIATKIPDNITVRRSANYPPSKWSHDFVASLKNEYAGEPYTTRVNKLKEEVKTMLESATNPLDQLEIIDALQRLGVAYHFEDQIETKLKSIYNDTFNKQRLKQDPHSFATALEFRLLRKHGYNVPQEAFCSFMDLEGNFKASLCHDLKGLVYLYEASYLSLPGEAILEEAQKFSSKNLKAYLKKENNSSTSGDDAKNDHLNMARHALELPFHWRMQRLEARWFIDVYENSPDMKPILLEHAKLDFNMVQAVHQQDLKHASSWWKGTGLGEKLAFVRARPMEGFLWTVGGVFEPQYGHFRRILSQVGALITVIDDIYDVYSTLDEVELFTEAVTRSVSVIINILFSNN
ncbi:(-)-alpha-terpineol synthase-like [Hevea brasiliensis]|uniref:(-)-alpha-terpineol synthase-like n=1 Tax=Hevea brasiliensis TaxID=3981 RepID=UPI0025D1E0E1|nr:(-)-alpha-terpineol synthase-like [Hevea brasiliensis]